MNSTTPEQLVQRQLEAYNARDLARFVEVYADDVRVWRPPSIEPALSGKAAFAEFYATQRFDKPGLHAEVVKRIVAGPVVVDHERIHGVRDQPFEAVVTYRIADGLIHDVWMHAAG
jgi:hypothetical protein